MFETPEEHLVLTDDAKNNVEDSLEYSPAFSQLAHAQRPPFDPFRGKRHLFILLGFDIKSLKAVLNIFLEIADPRVYLAQSLGKASARLPGCFMQLIGTLGDAEKAHLTQYLAACNVQIS